MVNMGKNGKISGHQLEMNGLKSTLSIRKLYKAIFNGKKFKLNMKGL